MEQLHGFAFQKRRDDDGISVDLERLSSYEKATLGGSRFRLLRLAVNIIRHEINDGIDVVHNPVENNSAHCLIIGNIKDGKQKQLLKYSTELTK